MPGFEKILLAFFFNHSVCPKLVPIKFYNVAGNDVFKSESLFALARKWPLPEIGCSIRMGSVFVWIARVNAVSPQYHLNHRRIRPSRTRFGVPYFSRERRMIVFFRPNRLPCGGNVLPRHGSTSCPPDRIFAHISWLPR